MKSMKVLIVEDELIISLLIERMVNDLGHNVVKKVTSGEDAIEAAEEFNPDVILMDIRLQGEINGIQAMTKIRKMQEDVRVIFISGNTDKLHSIDSGEYIEFLSKPITQSELDRSFCKAS